jgi:hypothetical protein
MVPKRVRTSSTSDFSEVKTKRSKKVMTLAQKAELLDKSKEGMSFAAVGCTFGVNESSARYIRKDEKSIRSRLPSRKFISNNEKLDPGFKAAKDRPTLIFRSNASALMTKPGLLYLLYRSVNTRALKESTRTCFLCIDNPIRKHE